MYCYKIILIACKRGLWWVLSNYVWCTTATSDTLQFPNFVSNLKKMMGGGWAGWLQQGALILIRIYSGEFWATMGHIPHLSKGTSGCQQKCTQFLTLFSGTVFHALSHGVIRFARSVSQGWIFCHILWNFSLIIWNIFQLFQTSPITLFMETVPW